MAANTAAPQDKAAAKEPAAAALAHVKECVSSAAAMRTAISEYHLAMGKFPDAGLFNLDAYRDCGALTHDANGVITVMMGSGANVHSEVRGLAVQLHPGVQRGQALKWRCSTDQEHLDHLPASCR